ncbi:argonaute-like protein [Guyanagaster necrorhizus]|uniref:Argonaute-like protein n=1 Tax=Guyanagaster necrorhizus TaxID=856835 RepID=A0A9P7W766_9AGAR|nr:argonaute-like protein [Guyanagaster necrorhizus MCA 3950]KAG7453210.1 argonaute-like protein [Guyanagaster necrorhizus MCA 3950]
MAPRKAHGQAGGLTRSGTKRGTSSASPAAAQSGLRRGFADQGTLQTSVSIASAVEVVGVKRPAYGKEGRRIKIFANVCEAPVPEGMIYQYDVQIYFGYDDKEKKFDMSLNRSLFEKMQNDFASIFTPPAVYDGKKIAFASHELDLGPSADKRQFDLWCDNGPDRPPKHFIICLTKSSVINLEVLQRFTKGQQSLDNEVWKARTAFNVVIRMAPSLMYPSRGRSFFMREAKSIGFGLSVCQGYFQSIFPAVDRLLINVDTTTGIMYKDGPLISLCLEYLSLPQDQAHQLDPRQLSTYERIRLQRFLSGMKIVPTLAISGARGRKGKSVTVKRLTDQPASMLSFKPRGGGVETTVAAYFQRQNQLLQYPHIICVETPSGAFIPLEKCEVLPGQIIKKEILPEATSAIVKFSTKPPKERLTAIKKGVELLQYGQSEYLKAFGLNVKSDLLPFEIDARVLPAPKLQYGGNTIITPAFGSWNMVDKILYKPASIKEWMVIIYADHSLMPLKDAQKMVDDLVAGCQSVGMTVEMPFPMLIYENGAGNISEQLMQASDRYKTQRYCFPDLIVAILPDYGNSGMYNTIKHFGQFKAGIAIQCLKAGNCIKAKIQYWANVALKINLKLGGINVIPASESFKVISDPQNATIVMGADVMHPAPGSIAPSYAALVSSVDKLGMKYIAKSSMQTSRQEMISSLRDMAKKAIQSYIKNRSDVEKITTALAKPKRLIFFRDGVSEGEFEQILEKELPLLKAACQDVNVNPKITFIIVIKRHHIRFFSDEHKDIDKSGNLIAGTVVDQDITSPVLFDWFLQSHGGLKGTSRSAHYTVLHDESNFSPDALQELCYVLCHTFARATKSVSIPAPVYYAHIVCSKAKQHYLMGSTISDAEISGSVEYDYIMECHRSEYKAEVHPNQQNAMYWM